MKTRKIAAVLLSVAMLLSLLTQAVWATEAEPQMQTQEPQGASEPLQSVSEGNPDSGISPMSLLPLEYYSENVTIDRTEKMPYELASQPEGTVYVYEVLKDILVKNGLMAEEDEKYNGTIVYSLYDQADYAPIEWDGTISLGEYSYGNVYFIVGDGDQLNPGNTKIGVYVTVNQYITNHVIIDRTVDFPEELVDQPEGTVFISELLNGALLENGLITEENPKYSGKIRMREYKYDNATGMYSYVWEDVTQEDTITAYSYDYDTSAYFTIDDGLGTDTSFKRFRIGYRYIDTGRDLLSETDMDVYDQNDEEVVISQRALNTSYSYQDGKSVRIYAKTNIVSGTELEKDEAPKISLTLPEKYASNTAVYLGLFRDESGIDETKNITEKLTGDEPYELTDMSSTSNYSSVPGSVWYLNVTFTVKVDEKTVFVPATLQVNVSDNYVAVVSNNSFYGYSSPTYSAYSGSVPSQDNFIGACEVVSAPDFAHVRKSLSAIYYDYIDGYYGDSAGLKVTSAYLGDYETEEEAIAAGAENIKDKLFSGGNYFYFDFRQGEAKTAYAISNAYYAGTQPTIVEIQLKSFVFTVFDEYDLVHHPVYNIGIDGQEVDEPLSDDTYFRISGADIRTDPEDKGTSRSLSRHIMTRADDSYSINGYQTVFITDRNDKPIADGTTIYPTFGTQPAVKVFNGLDVSEETDTNRQQISGESPVVFKNAEPIHYSAASESGAHLKNYWVTYITPVQGCAKLYVNGTNNPDHYDKELNIPVREIFFNSTYGYSHDIMIANIGDQPLEDIKVTLEDANGIELDPYWTILEDGYKKLSPYTSTAPTYGAYDENENYIRCDGELFNMAKIRLVPTDENFGAISGTLKISAKDQKDVVIKLTGIAGAPVIITDNDDICDGVKYVPYSSVIMTNSMYEDDAMEFSIIGGKLPEGIKLLPNGELYGIPTETGDFTFTVQAKYTGTIAKNSGDDYTDSRTYSMTVKDNSDENVDGVNADDQGYELTDRVSKNVTVYYTGVDANNLPIVDRVVIDSDLFRSEGSYATEFKDFYIDGIKLTKDADYTAEEGSTKITVLAETFGHIGISDKTTPHTLAAEFRNDKSDLKRSAQNVYLEYIRQTTGETNPSSPSNPSIPSDPGLWWPGYLGTLYPNLLPSAPAVDSVNVVMSIVDQNGNSMPNLSLELHSAVQYVKSNADGIAAFSSVEFGRHTLYITDPKTNAKASKTFTVVSGFDTEITEDIIVAEVGKTIGLTVTFDGKNISLTSAATELDTPQQGNENEEETEVAEPEENTDKEVAETPEATVEEAPEQPADDVNTANPATGIALCFIPSALATAACLVFKKK